jgi:hypothetical protein
MVSIVFLLALSAPIRVSIDAGDLREDLTAMIRAETHDVVITSSAAQAEIHVSVKIEGSSYVVAVSDMGERKLPDVEGSEPALRTAVLLVERRIESLRALDEPLEIPPPPSDLAVYVSSGVFTGWWQRPFTPSIGFGIGGGVDFETLKLGVLVVALGEPCCERSIDRIETTTARELLVLGDVAFSPVRWGRLWLHVRAAGGINRVHVDAAHRVDHSQISHVHGLEGVFRGGASADMELWRDRMWVGLGAGGWWRIGPLRVRNVDGDALFTGSVVPFVESRVSFNF